MEEVVVMMVAVDQTSTRTCSLQVAVASEENSVVVNVSQFR